MAILYRDGRSPRILRKHLRSKEQHTVFEAKVVGLSLAAELVIIEVEQ